MNIKDIDFEKDEIIQCPKCGEECNTRLVGDEVVEWCPDCDL